MGRITYAATGAISLQKDQSLSTYNGQRAGCDGVSTTA